MEIIALVAIVAIAAIIIIVKNKNNNAESGELNGQSDIKAAAAAAQGAPMVQAGIDDETVAAIMAAISCMTGTASGTTYAVRSINRAKSERPAWCLAGMQQNTRSF